MGKMEMRSLKIHYYGKIKRFSLPSNFQDLLEIIEKSFGLTENFDITYNDEENDSIMIENGFDYENSVKFISNSQMKTLHLTLEVSNNKYERRNALYDTIGGCLKPSSTIVTRSIVINTDNEFGCSNCKRKFSSIKSREIHSNVCSKIFFTKRKPFDSKKQGEPTTKRRKSQGVFVLE